MSFAAIQLPTPNQSMKPRARRTMHNPPLLFCALVSITMSSACVANAQWDPRFDGIWTGTETDTRQVQISQNPIKFEPQYSTRTVQIVIAQGGKLIGIVGGICAGRFSNVWWTGRRLNFAARDCKLSVDLSADGKTLTEHGKIEYKHLAVGPPGAGLREFQAYQIFGTFHRR